MHLQIVPVYLAIKVMGVRLKLRRRISVINDPSGKWKINHNKNYTLCTLNFSPLFITISLFHTSSLWRYYSLDMKYFMLLSLCDIPLTSINQLDQCKLGARIWKQKEMKWRRAKKKANYVCSVFTFIDPWAHVNSMYNVPLLDEQSVHLIF